MPTIAVLGASQERSKFGNKCVRAYLKKGYKVYPINPKVNEVEGQKTYTSILDIPEEQIDRVSVYLPESILLKTLEDVAKKRVGQVWLNPGADSPSVVQKAKQLGLNVICACSIVDIGMSPSELDG